MGSEGSLMGYCICDGEEFEFEFAVHYRVDGKEKVSRYSSRELSDAIGWAYRCSRLGCPAHIKLEYTLVGATVEED